jgi:hypothetical protein
METRMKKENKEEDRCRTGQTWSFEEFFQDTKYNDNVRQGKAKLNDE